MEIVELDCNGEWYTKGYRVGIRCNRWEQMEMVTNLYDFWLHQTYTTHQFDVHFTMTFGFSIEN